MLLKTTFGLNISKQTIHSIEPKSTFHNQVEKHKTATTRWLETLDKVVDKFSDTKNFIESTVKD